MTSTPSTNLTLDPTIVRGYDVRGYIRTVMHGAKTLKQNLTPELAEAFGRALGTLIEKGKTVAVTSDHRMLSPELVAGLTRGFVRVGINVLHNTPQPIYGNQPYLPTGALSWTLIKNNLAGSVQVTGSHNPPEFNGFKISIGLEALFGEALQKIIPMISGGKFRPDVAKEEQGKIQQKDLLADYLSMLRCAFPRFSHHHNIVVDVGNGIGRVITPVLQHAGCDVLELYPEPDARFPNHLADPSSEEGTGDLKKRIRELNKGQKNPDARYIGIALDGDSDRSGLVDEEGEVIWPERMAAIFYANYLKAPEHRGHVLALDVRASNVVRDQVEQAGGRGLFIPAGYPSHRRFASLVAPDIGKTRVGVSAEASGHFFFPTGAMDERGQHVPHAESYLIDDGIYSALAFLNILDQHTLGKKTSVVSLMSSLPTYATSNELRLFAPDEQKERVVASLRDALVAHYKSELAETRPMQTISGLKLQDGHAAIIEVDGIRLQFKDGAWLVVRMSNTSPMLVIKFEAKTKDRLAELMQVVRSLLEKESDVEKSSLDQELAHL